MKTGVIFYAVAAALTVGGMVTYGVGSAIAKSTYKAETFGKQFEEADSLDIDVAACDLSLVVSKDAKTFDVEFEDIEKGADAYVKDGTLHVKTKDRWHIMSFGFDKPEGKVRITVPEQELKNIKVKAAAVAEGNISGITAKAMTAELDAVQMTVTDINVLSENAVFDVNAGKLEISGSTFADIELDGDAFDISMTGSEINGKTDIDSDAGKAVITNCTFKNNVKVDIDAAEMKFVGTKLECDMDAEVDAGELKLGISGNKNDYSVSSQCDGGAVSVDGQSGSMKNSGSKYFIDIECNAGSVNVTFES